MTATERIAYLNRDYCIMQKGFCIFSLAVAGLVFVLFFADFLFGILGMSELAPFKYSSMVMDIVFIIGSGTIAALSFLTYRQQK
jgi:hypothetical protein